MIIETVNARIASNRTF